MENQLLFGVVKLSSVFLVAALFSGCAAVTVIEANNGPEERIGKVPAVGVESTVPVGSQVFSQFRYWSRTGFRVKDSYNDRLVLGRIVVSEGDFLVKASVDGKVAYCTEKRAYVDPLAGPFASACFVESTTPGSFGSVKARPGAIWFENKLAPEIRYERSELMAPKVDSFKYELLYQGISKGTLRLSYREYSNDMARPSYFQDVSYDIPSFPAEVAFKSVRLEVINADNNGIRYRVLAGFQ
jgi:hypothetical protein